jgi:hypothetical protein
MGLTVTHRFASAKADSSDATLIQPSNWNEDHVIAGLPFESSADYKFTAQTPGGSLIVGANTITLSPVPPGINVTNTNHYLYISSGTGTAEAVKIIGGTAVAGATSGTVIVTCAYTHSGAWTIQSATAGITEAMWGLSTSGGVVSIAGGRLDIYATIKRRTGVSVWLRGLGENVSILVVAANFHNSVATAVIDWTPGDGTAVCEGGGSNFSVEFIQPDSTNIATYTHWVPAIDVTGTYHTIWENIELIRCWDGIAIIGNTNGATFKSVIGSNFHYLFNLLGRSFDTVRVDDSHSSTTGLSLANHITAFLAATTGNIGIYAGTIDDLKVHNCTFGTTRGATFDTGVGGLGTAAEVTNSWFEGNITVNNGMIRFTNLIVAGAGTIPLFSHTGGMVHMVNASFLYTGSNTAIYSFVVRQASSAAGTYPSQLSFVNCRFDTQAFDNVTLSGAADGSYADLLNYSLIGCYFYRTAGTVYTTPCVSITNGVVTTLLNAIGNVFSTLIGGSGVSIYLGSDVAHVITGNDGGGGSCTLPGTTANLLWNNNNNFALNVHRLNDPLNLQSGTASATAGAVTLSKQSGFLTSESITTAAAGSYTLTVTNTLIAATSLIFASVCLGTSTDGTPQIITVTPGSGSAVIVIKNIHATQAFNGTIKVAFLIVNPS